MDELFTWATFGRGPLLTVSILGVGETERGRIVDVGEVWTWSTFGRGRVLKVGVCCMWVSFGRGRCKRNKSMPQNVSLFLSLWYTLVEMLRFGSALGLLPCSRCRFSILRREL